MAMPSVFTSEFFTAESLTAAVNEIPHVPGQVGRLNLFREVGITTELATFENHAGRLKLIPDTDRSAPGVPVGSERRKAVAFRVPHLPAVDRVKANEIIGVREFGS